MSVKPKFPIPDVSEVGDRIPPDPPILLGKGLTKQRLIKPMFGEPYFVDWDMEIVTGKRQVQEILV